MDIKDDMYEDDTHDEMIRYYSTAEPDLYQCQDCKARFSEPDFLEEGYESYEFWGQRGRHMTYLEVCPSCGSENIEEIRESEPEPEDDE